MENASKALIIAGAILLSILIIGLGMFIYNQAAGVMGGANLDPQKVAAYNSEFEQYEGTISGTKARALCDAVRAHNNGNTDETLNIQVMTSSAAEIDQISELTTTDNATAESGGTAINPSGINTIKSGLKAGLLYDIDFGYDSNTGYILAVGIRVHGNTNT